MITPRAFMALLPRETLLKISAACQQSPELNLWVLNLVAAQEVNAKDPDTIAGINSMVKAGLMTDEQARSVIAAITTPEQPIRTVSSTQKALGQTQDDGRFWLTILFVLSDGSSTTQNVLCEPSTDVDELIFKREADINAGLMEASRG